MTSTESSKKPLTFVIDDQFRIDKMVAALFATSSGRQRWCLICYNNSVPISIGLQLFMVIMFLIIDPQALKQGESLRPGMAAITIITQIIQLFIIFCAHIGMFREIQALYVRPNKIWNMYCATIIFFGAWYFMFFAFNPLHTFLIDGYAPNAQPDAGIPGVPTDPESDTQNVNDVPSVFIFLVYFSGAIMTSTGFGDIAPRLWHTQLFTNIQMIVGTMYHVGVFGLTLSHFRTLQRTIAPLRKTTLTDQVLSKIESIALYQRIQNHPLTAKIKHWCIQHLLIISIGFQLIITLLMFAIHDPFETVQSGTSAYTRKMIVIGFAGLVQFGEFCMVLFTSVRLVKDVNSKEVTAGFLLQSYLATALLFGGIYFVLFTATTSHEFYRTNKFNLTIFEVLYVYVHFSFTIFTTTGFGDVYARGVVSRIFVLAEMLICILYNAVIIGMGTSQLIDMQAAKAEEHFHKATHSPREVFIEGDEEPLDEPIHIQQQHDDRVDVDVDVEESQELSTMDSCVPIMEQEEHGEQYEESSQVDQYNEDEEHDYEHIDEEHEQDERNLRLP